MSKTTKITLKEAVAKARTMTAGEFDKTYEDQIELLDADNLLNPNDGVYNILFYGKDKTVYMNMFFIDGEYQPE